MKPRKPLSKITASSIPDPFSISTHKTERSAVAVFASWMRDIVEEKNIDLGLPDVETGGADRKFPDTVISKTRRSRDVLCLMEFKPPFWDVFQEEGFKDEARKKSNSRRAKYFVTSNFRELILWDTEKANANKPVEEQIVNRYYLSDVHDLNRIEDSRYKTQTKKALEQFLTELYQFYKGEKLKPRLAIDELLIYRLQNSIHGLAYYYENIIYDKAHKEAAFAQKLRSWFTDQGWSFFIEDEVAYERIARQTAYLLVNKILFYDALQLKRSEKLNPLKIPEDITIGGLLQSVLQGYFNEVLKIDYETIYTTDFIDEVAFPDSREVVDEIKKLVSLLHEYDFSTFGFDIIGRIFERLIPPEERHNLGQYFTNADVVDFILHFSSQHEEDKIFDPSCGAGTFLVRAYQQKKLMNQNLPHETILNTLWGNDIAKFPAHLATINLAINDLSVDKNYPRIIRKDFFDLLSFDESGFQVPEDVRKVLLKTMSGEEYKTIYPRWFDAIVGNPPYTRQEEISEISDETTYKDRLIQKALTHGAKIIANISRRAGIYAYFFIHGTKFLQNGGHFGFIVSNAWLDVEYGAGLQEFFLKNYKIVAIIESKVERWFEDADINTVIVILEKASGSEKKQERDGNLVRFVYLSKPLRHFIPAAQNIWAKQVERKQAIKNLIKTILAHNVLYQNEDLRVYPKLQSELWEEGFNPEEQKYIGAKWGKYLRAPEIFFKILEKGKDKLVPLKQIADVRFGIKTGANEFFYLTEEEIKRRKIEKEFWMHKDEKDRWVPNFVFTSPQESPNIQISKKDLSKRVILIKKEVRTSKNHGIAAYIKEGERKGFNKRETCAARATWYSLDPIHGKLFWIKDARLRLAVFYSPETILCDNRLYAVKTTDPILIGAILNSTLEILFAEFLGRQLGGGGGPRDIMTYEAKQLLVPNPAMLSGAIREKILEVFQPLANRVVLPIFDEIGAISPEQVTHNKIKPDRRALDQIIMGEILGLTKEEQLEVYRAVVDLVKSRIERAKSVGARRKTKKGIDVDAVIDTVLKQLEGRDLKNWYKDKILNRNDLMVKKLPERDGGSEIEKSLFGWQLKSGKKAIQCRSEAEARYLRVWLEAGAKSVKIPKDDKYLGKITSELIAKKKELDEVMESYLGSILDLKLKSQILHQIWQQLI
jgi:hypothetical protein